MKPFKLNRYLNKVPQALSIYWNQKASDIKSKNLIKLALGEPFFKIKKFNLNKHLNGENYHYTDSRGSASLRKKIAHLYRENYKGNFNYKNEIIISSGSKILTYISLLALLNKGDEVVTFEPAWLSYKEQANLLGCKTRFIPFSTPISSIAKYFNKKSKVFILNNPNNPSGKLYDQKFLKELYKILKKKNMFLISDEAYSDFIPHTKKFYSAISADKKKQRTIVVNSLSKNFGMGGWRIGYAIANRKITNKLLILNQHLITCAPSILQTYLSENFFKLYKSNIIEIKKLQKKRKIIENFMKKNNISYLDGDSTFYFFLCVERKVNVDNLCKKLLLKKLISVVPGRAYGKNTRQFIRVSIGTEKVKNITKALKIISKEIKAAI